MKNKKRTLSTHPLSYLLRYVTLFALSGVFIFTAASAVDRYASTPTLVANSYDAIATSTVSTSTPHMVNAGTTSDGHVATPGVVRGVYLSQCAAGSPELRNSIVSFVESTDLNTIAIDIKDASGGISFPTDDPVLAPFVSTKCGANDMKQFISDLHLKGIYVIGRITVFQDPWHTKTNPEWAVKTKEGGIWKNYGGIAFIDVGARPYWDYVVDLARVAHDDIGFDEINLDYVRFPSDGPLSDADFTFDKGVSKEDALEQFFAYFHDHMSSSNIPTSADLFGMVSSHHDDLGIGQVLERALPYFDYIDTMLYPSHYPKTFDGYADVNAHAYDIVYREMQSAVSRSIAFGSTTPSTDGQVRGAAQIRPWLQSFDYPVPYTPSMVSDQIKATTDAGGSSYLFWDAGNSYTSLRAVLTHATSSQ